MNADALWGALKRQACVHPETAVRIVTLQKHDVVAALKELTAMKATLEFNLPDEHAEYQQAAHAGDLARIIDETHERLRRRLDAGITEGEHKFLSDLIESLAPVMPIVFGEHLT